jgi:site-specific recombinase XerD
VFRDTFAVELLNKGVPIDRVSLLLGHSSVKLTEKHYSLRQRAPAAIGELRKDGVG